MRFIRYIDEYGEVWIYDRENPERVVNEKTGSVGVFDKGRGLILEREYKKNNKA